MYGHATGLPAIDRDHPYNSAWDHVGSSAQLRRGCSERGGAVSNVTALTVVQPIVVGNAPVGVAVDTDRDLAVVTNAGERKRFARGAEHNHAGGNQPIGGRRGGDDWLATDGGIGSAGRGGDSAAGLGAGGEQWQQQRFAGRCDASICSADVSPCGSTGGSCTGPTAVAINQDTAQAVITNAGILNDTAAPSSISFGTMTPGTSSAAPTLASPSTDGNVDQNPVSVAIDPTPIAANPGVSYIARGNCFANQHSGSYQFCQL